VIELDENTTSCTETKGKNGQRSKWTEETRNAEGVLISRRVDEYYYYPSGEIHKIKQSRYDNAEELISRKTVEHFLNKKQRIVATDATSDEIEIGDIVKP